MFGAGCCPCGFSQWFLSKMSSGLTVEFDCLSVSDTVIVLESVVESRLDMIIYFIHAINIF